MLINTKVKGKFLLEMQLQMRWVGGGLWHLDSEASPTPELHTIPVSDQAGFAPQGNIFVLIRFFMGMDADENSRKKTDPPCFDLMLFVRHIHVEKSMY